eukprot:TRINITY_DN854_c0_g1_i27.p1 TRINITY_DN854_c0_g1~~TRINITY_DN854_c0_g1_i27.p1  ORF type:complete len:182 (+),score=30.32 TRINITY_DN854_c0_g1_i27:69-614(+)
MCIRDRINMLKIIRNSTSLVQVRQCSFKSREELEAYLSVKVEEGLKYLESMQTRDNSKEAQEDLVKSIARTNYLSKYFLCNMLKTLAQENSSLRKDQNFLVAPRVTVENTRPRAKAYGGGEGDAQGVLRSAFVSAAAHCDSAEGFPSSGRRSSASARLPVPLRVRAASASNPTKEPIGRAR